MSDINLSIASRSNLLALQSTQSLLTRTSNRLSTGLKVSKPIDDTLAYFAAKALTDQADTYLTAQTNITQTSNILETAISGLKSITKLVQSLQGTLSSLSNATSRTQSDAILSQYNTLLAQIDNLANSSSYQGINLINTATNSIGVSFSGQVGVNDLTISSIRSDSAGLNFTTISAGLFFTAVTTIASQSSRSSIASIASVASTAARAAVNEALAQLQSGVIPSSASRDTVASTPSVPSNATNSSVPSQSSQPSIASVESQASRASAAAVNASVSRPALAARTSVASISSSVSMQSVAGATVAAVNVALINSINTQIGNALVRLSATQSTLGSINAVLAVRLEFSKSYVATLQSGAASLTVADLNEESANLTSLQTAQSLGVVSLSITNQAQQSLLRLF